MFAGSPPSSSELTERKSVVAPSPPADRRREHRGSAYFVVARRGKSASAPSSLDCSLRSVRLALVSRCLPHSLADESMSARSIVQDNGAQPGSARRARFPTLAAVGSASTPSDIHHNAPKDTPKLSRSTCIPLRIRYCFGSVHRLKLKRGPPAAANHSVLRQRQDSGNLSSYQELECQARRRRAHARVLS